MGHQFIFVEAHMKMVSIYIVKGGPGCDLVIKIKAPDVWNGQPLANLHM